MNELHPAAVELAKIDGEYAKLTARLAALKTTRREKRAAHRAAIIEAIGANPDATHVDLAAWFGVAEGTIRYIRSGLAQNPTT